MIFNTDSVVKKNKYVSLCPMALMIDEIPLPNRRYSKSIILGGVLPTLNYPTSKAFQTIMNIIYQECAQLVDGF